MNHQNVFHDDATRSPGKHDRKHNRRVAHNVRSDDDRSRGPKSDHEAEGTSC